MEYHNTKMLGKDWREQMEQDFIDAAREVQDGYITGEIRSIRETMTDNAIERW